MEPDLSQRSEQEIHAIKEALEIDRNVQVGRALIERIESAVEGARYRLSESLVELDKRLRGR